MAGRNKHMKYERFKPLGAHYPHALEQKYERILGKIDELWGKPDIDAYLSDLLLDKRGGRKGFPSDVLADIMRLSQYHDQFALHQVEQRENAIATLAKRSIILTPDALFRAVEHGDQELLDLLLRAGIHIHVKDHNGSPPLLVALAKGYTIIAQMLIKAGAEVNDMDRRKLTPLLLACGKPVQGYQAVAETLIRKGAFVNFRDALGNTPLLLALSGGTEAVAELLIEQGADLSVTTRSGDTALSLAQKSGKDHLVKLIQVKLEERAEKQTHR